MLICECIWLMTLILLQYIHIHYGIMIYTLHILLYDMKLWGKERLEVKGEYGGIWEEEEGNSDYWGMVQPSQQHVAPCVKGIGHDRFENGGRVLGRHLGRGYTVVPRCWRAAIGTPFIDLIYHAGRRWAYSTPALWGGEGGKHNVLIVICRSYI